MSIATDVRFYADTALAQGKAALSNAGNAAVLVNKRLVTDAPKPAYAALGAADLVASVVTRRVEGLPVEAADNVYRAQQNGRTLLSRRQNDAVARLSELRGRLDAGLESVSALPVAARNATEAYLSTAKDLYGKLTARGEARAAELRSDPRVSRLLGQAGEMVDSVQGTVSPVVKSAFDAVESVSPVETKPVRKPVTRPATRKATAAASAPRTTSTRTRGKSTAAKSTAAKSTAAKSTAAKSTAAKSTAAKSTATKRTAVKSTASKSKSTGTK